MHKQLNIGFIGGGNMATAIIAGLVKSHPPSLITVSEPNKAALTSLSKKYSINTTSANESLLANCNIIILAVKPQIIKTVLTHLSKFKIPDDLVFVSIAAGITITNIRKCIGNDSKCTIVRCMPNTPSLVNEGACGFYADNHADEAFKLKKGWCDMVMGSVSPMVYWVANESLLDVVTGVSGSGPAYFFLIIECLQRAGTNLGLPANVAQGLAIQTCLGAGKMAADAMKEGTSVEELRSRVTSPNGTTHAGIEYAKKNGAVEIWEGVVKEATRRSVELGVEMGDAKM